MLFGLFRDIIGNVFGLNKDIRRVDLTNLIVIGVDLDIISISNNILENYLKIFNYR
jgi:hypothetical protein